MRRFLISFTGFLFLLICITFLFYVDSVAICNIFAKEKKKAIIEVDWDDILKRYDDCS